MSKKDKNTAENVSPHLADNENYFKDRIGLGTSFDLGVRKFIILNKGVQIYFLNGLCDTQVIIQLLKELVNMNEKEDDSVKLDKIIENRLVHQQVSTFDNLDEAVDNVLSGLIIIFIEGDNKGLIVDVRSYPGRQPAEPDTEKVIRGSRDGYVENIIVNTALTRRRIRDERLRFEMLKVGERSKTDVCIAYIRDVADPGLIKVIKKEIKAIEIDGLTMADKTVEEFIIGQGYNPFPLVRYTERPDVAASHLLEGHVLIMVDTSPSVIITPTTFFHHVQHVEEYRQNPAIGTFIRWVRYSGIFGSIFLLPFWYLVSQHPELLPAKIDYIGPNDTSHIPMILQLIFADIGVEFLRMAAIHTPTPLSTAMGLIAAVLIGQIAIDVGLFVPEVILYVAIAAVGSYATPSYELSMANKVSRMFLLIVVGIFGIKGFIIGVTVYILLLVRIRSLNTPYLWPFLPFEPRAFFTILIRPAVPGAKLRPSIVHPQNKQRQP